MTNQQISRIAPLPAQNITGEYALATGARAVHRLGLLHSIYAPTGRRVMLKAGLKQGMKVADFGCGAGFVTRMLAEMVGPSGHVTGVDLHQPQLDEARTNCHNAGLHNVAFHYADACNTGLPRESFDFVYCRYLLLHLPEPDACLREMRSLLKPGGIILVEDGDLASAGSVPETSLKAFADLWSRLGPTRGLDYSLATNLYHMVKNAGFENPDIEIHQPAITSGEDRYLLHHSVEEAGPAYVSAGIISQQRLRDTLAEMREATEDPNVLVIMPRMSLVWARK